MFWVYAKSAGIASPKARSLRPEAAETASGTATSKQRRVGASHDLVLVNAQADEAGEVDRDFGRHGREHALIRLR